MAPKSEKKSEGEDRRGFMKLLGLGGVASGVATVTGAPEASAGEAKPETEGGYQETDHVRRYYELARF